MKSFLLVFIGGGLGSALRFLINNWLPFKGEGIPWNTFSVNILGSYIIGLILGYYLHTANTNNAMSLLLVTGFCGGFTTFSAFAFENSQLLKNGDFTTFSVYVVGSIFLGILAVLVGIWTVKLL